jgi:hypothetical protein
MPSWRAPLPPFGQSFMWGLSDRQPGVDGPWRVSKAENVRSFREGWGVDAIEAATSELWTEITRRAW